MNEEEKQGQGNSTENSTDGNESKEPSLVERADTAAKRLEEATKKAAEERAKLEELEARRALGGRTAQTKTEEKKEDNPEEYARKALANRL